MIHTWFAPRKGSMYQIMCMIPIPLWRNIGQFSLLTVNFVSCKKDRSSSSAWPTKLLPGFQPLIKRWGIYLGPPNTMHEMYSMFFYNDQCWYLDGPVKMRLWAYPILSVNTNVIIPIRLATKGLLVLEVGQLDWPHTGSLQVRTDLVQNPHCLWAAFLWHFIPWQNRFLNPWSYRTP